MKTKAVKLSTKRVVAVPSHAVVPLKERRLNFGNKWDYAPAPEDSKSYVIAPRHDLFIGGKFVAPSSGKYFPSINPATEQQLTEIAAAASNPQHVVGLHFFSPANVMRLLEVVRGDATAQDVLATSMALAKTIKKQAVVSGVCDGFIGNRMIEQYSRQAGFLLEEGCTPLQVDKVIYDRKTKRVFAEGRVKITERDGTESYADKAELTDDFRRFFDAFFGGFPCQDPSLFV